MLLNEQPDGLVQSVADASVIESGIDVRKRERDEAQARDLVRHLERQAREILHLATAARFDNALQSFAAYRSFRERVGEFEAFCNVIETHLRGLSDEPRGVLNELLHTRHDMILGPSVKAMSAFYAHLAEGALPLGLHDMLERELEAVAVMRETLDSTGSHVDNAAEIRAAIDHIEATLRALDGRATQFDDFETPEAVAAILPPEVFPAESEAVLEQAAPQEKKRDTPELRAVREIRGILETKVEDERLGRHAEIDLRALDDIERRLSKDPNDGAATKWLRNICGGWGSRLRTREHVFARLLNEIR